MLSDKQIVQLEKKVAEILTILNFDLNDPSLKETPRRVAKYYDEFFGYVDANIHTQFDHIGADQMVVLKDIPFNSLCEHHMLPFFGTVTIAYIPGTKIIGVSKLARIAKLYASTLQVQERLATQIADQVESILEDAQGIGVYIQAHHTCMSMRGIKSSGNMVTTVLRGSFKNLDTKDEFLRYALSK